MKNTKIQPLKLLLFLTFDNLQNNLYLCIRNKIS